MKGSNKPFDETLYRLVEGSDTADFKDRLKRDPLFREDFEQTRKTVISLQGLGPKPRTTTPSGFTPKDFDRLTRDIIKGYRKRLAGLFHDAGYAFSLEAPRDEIQAGGEVHEVPIAFTAPDSEQSTQRLEKTATSLRSVAGKEHQDQADKYLDGLKSIQQSPRPSHLDLALRCHQASRVLVPRVGLVLCHEGGVELLRGNLDRALALSQAAMEVARTDLDRETAVCNISSVFWIQGRYGDAKRILEEFCQQHSPGFASLYNLASNNLNLGLLGESVDVFTQLAALAPTNPELARKMKLTMGAAEHFHPLNEDARKFDRLLKVISTYLGSELAENIEAKS